MTTRRKINPVVLALIALMFTVVWLPEPLALAKPCWVLLLVLYLQIFAPAQFSVLSVMLLGLLLDVLCPNVMGVHSLALLSACCCLSGRSRRFQFFPMPQQMMWIGALSLLYQFILAALAFSMGHALPILAILLPVITTTLFWPWLTYACDQWVLRARA